jgi:hypothetical protein
MPPVNWRQWVTPTWRIIPRASKDGWKRDYQWRRLLRRGGICFIKGGVGPASRRSVDRQQTSEAGKEQRLPRESFRCLADERLFGGWAAAGDRIRPLRHDSGGNDDVRDGRRGRVCLPPGVGGKLREVQGSVAGPIRAFEAFARVKIARGVPVEAELVTVRAR